MGKPKIDINTRFERFQQSPIGKFLIEKVFFRKKSFYSILSTFGLILIAQLSAYNNIMHWADKVATQLSHTDGWAYVGWLLLSLIVPEGNLFLIIVLLMIIIGAWIIRYRELKQVQIEKIFEPTIDWAKEKVGLFLKSIGNRYITYNKKEYEQLNQRIDIQEYFKYVCVDNFFSVDNFLDFGKVDNLVLLNKHYNEFQDMYNNFIRDSTQEVSSNVSYFEEWGIDTNYYKFFNKYYNELTSIKNSIIIIDDLFSLMQDGIKQNKSLLFHKDFFDLLFQIEEVSLVANKLYNSREVEAFLAEDDHGFRYLSTMYSFYTKYLFVFKDFFINKTMNTDKFVHNINVDNTLSTYLFKYSLITGEAMSGKTHLLSDIANERVHDNKPIILIYAQKFEGYSTPIQQIIKQLHLEQYQYTDEEFLEVINEWGKKTNELVFLIIDAINETPDKKVWKNHFIEFVSMVKKYPYIALIMSIRDVEKRVIFTKDIANYVQSHMIEIEHVGFKEIEYPVLKKFCKVFDVNLPKFPLISPIFANPGLMFLFFETLKRKGIVDINEQVLKPNFIIEEYIKDRNQHFKELNNLLDRRAYIHQGTNIIASKMAPMDFIEKVKYDDIYNDVGEIHQELLEYLISEGILLEQSTSLDEVYLYFSYQRFGNYFIALYLLSGQITIDNLPNRDVIYSLFNNYQEHQALVEALIIRLSENNQLDFIDIFPELFDNRLNSIRYECFSKSLKLPSTIEYKMSNLLNLDPSEKSDILDLLLHFAYEELNQFNIEKILHPFLLSLSMPDRDYNWSIYLHNSYREDGIVKRIIHWAWDKKEEFEIEDESLYLYGLTLGWFLTSSNRELRDGATKALVNLFTDRVDVFARVLKEFETVDDLYVLERLYAVGYGVVLRSRVENGFKELGEYLYETIFNQSEVIEHSFIRDYTRLTIDYVSKIYQLQIDKSKIEPPYSQHKEWEMPKIDKDYVETYRDDYSGLYWSLLKGDFKKYIVYPLLNRFMNFKIKDRPHPKSPKQRYDEFFDALTQEQREEYEKTKLTIDAILSQLVNDHKDEPLRENDEIDIPDISINPIADDSVFKNILSSRQRKEYDRFIVTYRQSGRYENGIDVKNVKRLILVEAVKLGWDKELFEEFDKYANNGRETGTERIGKKYQWIALYKVLSRLADNYEFREDGYGEKIIDYRGMYQFSHNRDIDPSTILKSKTISDERLFDIDTKFENLKLDDKEWMNSTHKLPTIKQLVNTQEEDKEFLTLHLSFSNDGTKTEKNYRNLYYHIDAFVLKKDCIQNFVEWLGTVNYYGQSKLPQANRLDGMYLREYPNSEAFNHLDIAYYGQVDWEDSFGDMGESMPCKILLTSTSYMNEGQSYDKSVEETIEVSLPHKWFVNEMELKQTLVDGEWKNIQDEVVFFDPTINTGNTSPYKENGTLVADKKLLMSFLESKGYGLVWVMWGEKQVRSSGDGFNNEEFLGIAEISGYGYFDGDEFVEDIKIEYNNE